MGQLVNGVLELAERMAKRHIPMTMEDWAKQIDTILAAGGNKASYLFIPNACISIKNSKKMMICFATSEKMPIFVL